MSILTPPIFRTSVTKPKIASPKGTKIKTISDLKITCGVPKIKNVVPLVVNEKRKTFLAWYFRWSYLLRLHNPRGINKNYSIEELTDKLENR